MFSKEQLETYKEKLEQEKQKIQQELSKFGVAKGNDPDNYDSFIPQIGLSDEDNTLEATEYLNRLSSEGLLEDRLKEINQAIHKIKVGNFGVCEKCKEDIEERKLDINPAAESCIKCTKRQK